ncbi:MAG: hypothetical protein A2928_02125 [Candidatus Taylorbacteria bacterium RIFCSPLOWO2_01_FULL_45_15b]|uniref:Uncharacterized protein n=1 Tax=Candidatus Taylorbacteria bacterium RIFCSPLOWO2_01_FULL_45_15b TaxID=1802319 RepID=A0A1G2N703_9BACT|nr:MAG: hypothetical protein A2928_02125 [Candidatus Taylorbacteria bacterium RIFCSPLOWO2_01_FULL_45_15b]
MGKGWQAADAKELGAGGTPVCTPSRLPKNTKDSVAQASEMCKAGAKRAVFALGKSVKVGKSSMTQIKNLRRGLSQN